ncbi:Putative glycosyl transferase [Erwinia amylovora Ea644]|nr:Putative glycosyl transferase [Erwinia amylovora Ea644]
MNISIYTSHHKPSAFLSSPVIKPIHVGKANSLDEICCPGDDSGDSISLKNPFYCELTAHYWVWKNTDISEYVGFMHYRRHFNFSDDQFKDEDVWGMVSCSEIDADYENEFGLDEDSIKKCIGDADLLLPKKWSVKAAGNINNFEHYKVSDHLHIEDYQNALDILTDKYPEYKKAVTLFNDAHNGYYTNMYVMKRDLFIEYSDWLFSILSDLEETLYFKNYSQQEKRVFGHISERLFNIFIIKKIADSKIKIKEIQRTFIRKETFNSYLLPQYISNSVPIVICSDDNYAMALGGLIKSIINNASSDKNYDLVILDNGLTVKNKHRILSLIEDITNFSVRFFSVHAFDEIKDAYIRPPFTIATYSRLFIPRLFRHFEKVVFIDTDTVVESDLAELIDISMGDNLVAAVQDIVMEGFVKFGNIAESDDGIQTAGEYLKSKLALSKPEEYFQGGIMVFNIEAMNKENIFSRLMSELKGQSFWFLDQDIMNKVFHGRVHFLPLEWNVYHGNGHTDTFYPNLKFSTYSRYLKARKTPKMIHFAGENKPWHTDKVDYYDNFIKNIQGTPWELEVYSKLIRLSAPASTIHTKNIEIGLLQTKIKRKLLPYLDRIAPRGTKRRSDIARLYYKIRRSILG